MFIHSLPLFFSYMDLASPVELLIIFAALFFILFFTLPRDENNPKEGFTDNYLFSSWSGGAPLRWVFWPFFLFLNVCLFTVDVLAKTSIFTVSSWDDVHWVMLFPIAWWTMAVWRCSKNSKIRVWGAGARLMTLTVFFEYALKLAIRIDYPRIFFACEELLLDYGNCF